MQGDFINKILSFAIGGNPLPLGGGQLTRVKCNAATDTKLK